MVAKKQRAGQPVELEKEAEVEAQTADVTFAPAVERDLSLRLFLVPKNPKADGNRGDAR